MIIGVVKELKEQENRVAMTPAGVDALKSCGHRVLVEKGAGLGSGFSDHSYEAAGAEMIDDASKVWENCELMVKVKEPHESEYKYLRPGLIFLPTCTWQPIKTDTNFSGIRSHGHGL